MTTLHFFKRERVDQFPLNYLPMFFVLYVSEKDIDNLEMSLVFLNTMLVDCRKGGWKKEGVCRRGVYSHGGVV